MIEEALRRGLGLGESQRAQLVSADGHLLELAPRIPVVTPTAFLQTLDEA